MTLRQNPQVKRPQVPAPLQPLPNSVYFNPTSISIAAVIEPPPPAVEPDDAAPPVFTVKRIAVCSYC